MTSKIFFITTYIGLFLFSISLFGGDVWAQEPNLGIALKVSVVGGLVPDGTVVCTAAEGVKPCDEAYSTALLGVVVDQPAVALENVNDIEGQYVLKDGIARVRVIQGEQIVAGDLLTSSSEAGLATKAVKGGYVLGIARADLAPGEEMVEVLLQVHPESRLVNARTNLFEVLQKGTQASVLEPLDSLRYLLAAALVIISFTLGFIYFGRMTRASIEAIGRNPLAQKEIRLSVITHMVVTFVVVIVGLGAAYLVLIL